MKVAVIGGGFVGRATGKGLAKHGNKITFVDLNPEKVKELRTANFEAFEPKDYPKITTDITMLCVPTPTKANNIQLVHLKEAVVQLAERLKTHKKYHLIVIRSTVPPYTTGTNVRKALEKVSGKKAGKDFGLCMQPEYLREATASEDFERPWLILIGEYDRASGKMLEKLYKPFDAPILHMGLEEAEFQKYAHNVYNAVKIAFFNELRIAAKKEGWDADAIFRATAESSEGIWNPLYGLRDYGPFDGSCLPKDARALLEWGDIKGHNFNIVRTVLTENMRHEEVLGKNENVRVNYLADISV